MFVEGLGLAALGFVSSGGRETVDDGRHRRRAVFGTAYGFAHASIGWICSNMHRLVQFKANNPRVSLSMVQRRRKDSGVPINTVRYCGFLPVRGYSVYLPIG